MNKINMISPQETEILMKNGAILIDIRSPQEFQSENINQSVNLPLEQLYLIEVFEVQNRQLIFYCFSGVRTINNTEQFSRLKNNDIYILEGGISNWKETGRTVNKQTAESISIFRQVQIIAGLLIVAGWLLGTFVASGFYLLSGLVGAGLLFAGLSGFCGLAVLLMKMPWNKPQIKH